MPSSEVSLETGAPQIKTKNKGTHASPREMRMLQWQRPAGHDVNENAAKMSL